MMIADTGDIPKVTGRRRETAAVGPNPGRTPVRVPRNTPTKQEKRFPGSNPILNP
jgi:hypothetical protein